MQTTTKNGLYVMPDAKRVVLRALAALINDAADDGAGRSPIPGYSNTGLVALLTSTADGTAVEFAITGRASIDASGAVTLEVDGAKGGSVKATYDNDPSAVRRTA